MYREGPSGAGPTVPERLNKGRKKNEFISNMKIGKKITLVLGVVMLLLAGLSAVSLWGIRTDEKAAITLAQRLTKARLAGSVQGDTSAITMNLAKMVLSGKRSSETADRIQELRKSRTAALEQFVAMADTPDQRQTWRGYGGAGAIAASSE